MKTTQDTANLTPLRFIIIDDDRVSNMVSKLVILKYRADCQVEVFTDPEAALDRVKQVTEKNSEDVRTIILLDINMPLMSGWDFLTEISKHREVKYQQCAIFMLSSSLDRSDIEKAEKHPLVSGFFSKPLSLKCVQKAQEALPATTGFSQLSPL